VRREKCGSEMVMVGSERLSTLKSSKTLVGRHTKGYLDHM
jgi:hypothetical protein